MIRFRRSRSLLVIAATLGLAAAAWAEAIFPVNDAGSGNWVFDQPSVVANGSIVHVAFVGDNASGADNSPNTRVYYAAVNGSADFTNKETTRSQVLVTAPVAIDNALFNDARHPRIVQRSATELTILFQAIPVGETNDKLFLAQVTIGNNAVTSQRVDEIRDAAGARIPGKLTDPSFAIVTTDNAARVAFSSSPSLVAGSPYSDVYYARVGLDNARVVGNAILLTSTASTTGVSALPRLLLDRFNYSHIVWAANNPVPSDPTQTSPTGVYYALVYPIPPSVADNIAIGATQVLSGGYRWGFPNVLLTNPGNIWILAADEPFGSTGMAGSVGVAAINPYVVTPDGNPVNVNNVGPNTSFYLNPPGGSLLPNTFDAYQPEAAVDSQNRLNVAGYGFRDVDGHGTPGRYYVTSLGTTALASGLVASPLSVGTGDIAFAMQLPGDYTRPAFAPFSGAAVQFWSGPDNVVTGARNLYVTSTFAPPNPSTQSGCSMVDDPRDYDAGRIPGAAALLLPAALLALRRAARKAFAR
jgi:hypothetical protein